VDCPGTVSLSAAQNLPKISETVVVDHSEIAALPPLVKKSFLTGGASLPIVILTDPATENLYGRFDHPRMKSQKYDLIFKDSLAKISAAHKNGNYAYGEGLEPKIVKITGSTIESWKSVKGTTLKARLIAVENDSLFVLEKENGKTIKVKAAQLAPESIKKALTLSNKP